ncbi:MAG: DUF2726 domain-containing protein [Clostridia bacterium]|nr:DUF2726 domain-containing protein [Clostridia bacterium]
MNPNQVLIYFYSTKKDSWFDATDNVYWYERDEKAWRVVFSGSNHPVYVSFRKMRVFDSPKNVEFANIIFKHSPCTNVTKLILFNDKIYKIFYSSGFTSIAWKEEIEVVKDFLKKDISASKIISYYRDVVKETCKSEEDVFLVSQFENLSYVNENSVLALYLQGALGRIEQTERIPMICPFGLNESQMEALKRVFENRMAIIEGPPGTGKTQTILNIISNAVIRGKSVAVVSNNNSATNNVYEKLEKYGYSFIAAPLGNAENVTKFFCEYKSDVPKLEEKQVDEWRLRELFNDLPLYCEIENEIKKEIEKQNATILELKHFLQDKDISKFQKYYRKKAISPEFIMDLIVKLKEKKKIGFLKRMLVAIRLGITKRMLVTKSSDVLQILEYLYYISKNNKLSNRIKVLNRKLENQSVSERVKELISLSQVFFTNKLVRLYMKRQNRVYEENNYKKLFNDFLSDYPVVLSSTYSLAKCSQKGYLFDYLIVDESSQVNMASALLSMQMAKNIVVVGDTKQLPQIDDESFKERNSDLLRKYNVKQAYSYYGNNIMSSFLSLYGNRIPKQLLKEHYRCDPNIINFCNEEFYNNELIVYKEKSADPKTMTVVKTVQGNFARKNPYGSGLYNQREIDEIKKIVEETDLSDIGVITPYAYQAELIQAQLGDKVDASTIHKFQGREKKTIIFSSVVNDTNDFVNNENLINVAVSRATDRFILVTSDKAAKSKTGVLSDLVGYISYHGDFGHVEEGTVRSVYDLLYEEYQEALARFKKKYPSKDYDTENITKVLIGEIIASGFNNLRYAMHVSLKEFVKLDHSVLSAEENRFLNNPNSHADFLIYNKMSKKPLGVIEVDGVSFHEQQKAQTERDAKKDCILEKAGIPLLRLKTNESNEKERIIAFLQNLLK